MVPKAFYPRILKPDGFESLRAGFIKNCSEIPLPSAVNFLIVGILDKKRAYIRTKPKLYVGEKIGKNRIRRLLFDQIFLDITEGIFLWFNGIFVGKEYINCTCLFIRTNG